MVLIEELNSYRAEELIGKIDTVLLPVGTLEAHGPHCSVMSDVLIPTRICEDVEKLTGDRVFIAPVIPFGHTWHLKDKPGSHDVPYTPFSDYVYHVLKGFLTWKVKYAVIMNGHGGNIQALHYAAERASDAGVKTVVLSWWAGGFADAIKGMVQDVDGHAGESETSFLWFVGDKYVDQSLIPKEPHMISFDKGRTAASFMDTYDENINRAAFPRAYSGNPAAATKEKGRRMNEIVARGIVDVIDALRAGTIASQ